MDINIFFLETKKNRMIAVLCLIFVVVNVVVVVSQPLLYYVIKYDNVNNIYGAVESQKSSEYVTYLGKFGSTDDCMNACIGNSTLNSLCYSYTYQTSKIKDDFEKTCYARFGRQYGLYWNPYPNQIGINSGQIIWKCQTDLDCSLNGMCSNITGNCTCNQGWKGPRCNQLNFGKTTKEHGYNYLNANDDYYSSWGGKIQFSPKDDSYYMVASEFVDHCGIYSWVMNSRVILAKSKSNHWNDVYERVSVLSLPDSHEPDFVRGPNGEYIVYYSFYNRTLEGYPNPCKGCHDGSTGNVCKGPESPLFYTQMMYTNDITQNPIQWSEPEIIFHNGNAVDVDTNFAATILKNGSLVGLLRDSPDASIIYLVTASNWKDPNTYIMHDNKPLFPQLIQWYAEDPSIWIDCNGNFHGLFHNLQTDGNDINNIVGAHAFSKDGINWIWSGFSYGPNVEFTDGTTMNFHSLERPHIILDGNDGCSVVGLTNGAFPGDGNTGYINDQVYTLLQPVASV